MIFNRTQNDVDLAINIRKKLQNQINVNGLETLTPDEINALERGTLTINTLNRIENKTLELKQAIVDMGYYGANVVIKEWNCSQYFKPEHFERILENLNHFKKSFFVYKDTPATPENNYRKFQVINDVEKIIYDLEKMADDVKNKYRQCGTFQCGEENIVD